MKISKVILYCIVWHLFFYFIPLGDERLQAAKVEDKRWSLDFKNCTISDALRQMTKVTGIDIFTDQNRDKELFSKSYKDQTIDQILRDLFRKDNCAMIWSYGDDGLDAIGVWIFEGSGSAGSFDPKKFMKQRGASHKTNRIRKNVSYKSLVLKRQSQKTRGHKPLTLQSKSKDYIKESKESIGSQYSKVSTGRSQSKFGHMISGADESEATPALSSPMPQVADSGTNDPDEGIAEEENETAGTVPPPPAPEEFHGLEPPPMPPGFSYRK